MNWPLPVKQGSEKDFWQGRGEANVDPYTYANSLSRFRCCPWLPQIMVSEGNIRFNNMLVISKQ
ncbi:hypothetical protein KDAU_33320 [Dictyobacter aurantiacus]|uniref:Uncharacterized protein n=1 Tax=Dictyobacter aurantiacus TaxID=1936993 RepID=A0A401ZGT0_9CHLR|nr:hypothetical protein KDAU_33320 [Dictyobacter aurantiacus]